MASTFAHYKFGHLAAELLPQKIKTLITQNEELFDIGLHGPDILFYYKPYKNPKTHNEVSGRGYGQHSKPAKDFFENAFLTAKNGSDADMAYVLGCITHFVLDTAVHSYIQRLIENTGLSHIEAENEFDRALLVEDGYNPLTEKLCGHLNPSEDNCLTVSHFWREISPKQIKEAINSMKRCCDALVTNSYALRGAYKAAFKLSRHYKQLHGLLLNRTPNPLFIESNRQLNRRLEDAIPVAKELMEDFYNDKPLGQIYNRTFGDNGSDIVNINI